MAEKNALFEQFKTYMKTSEEKLKRMEELLHDRDQEVSTLKNAMGDLLERLEKAKTGFDVDAVADLSAPPAAAGSASSAAQAAPAPTAVDAPPPGAGRRRGRGGAISSESMAMASSAAPFKVNAVKKDDESRERIENAVAGNILFSHLDDSDRDTLVDAMAPKTFTPGSTIIKQGDDGDFFYIIDSGDCDVYVAKGNKPAAHVSTIGRGGCFGELALMYNCPRAATIKAKTPVETFTLDRNTFQHLLSEGAAKKSADREKFLGSVPLFQPLSKAELSTVADALETVEYLDGEEILTEGDVQDFVCILEKGQAVALKAGKEVKSYKRGDYFGELAMLNQAPRAASVKSIGPCTCVTLERSAFERVLGPCENILKRNRDLYKNYAAAINENQDEEDDDDDDAEEEEDDDSAVTSSISRGQPQARGRGRKQAVSAETFVLSDGFTKKNIPKAADAEERIRKSMEGNLIFSDLDSTQMSDVVAAMEEARYSGGTNIITQGEEGDNFYVVDSGEADAFVNVVGKQPKHVFSYGKGGGFGELALMYNCPRAATVKARTDCVVWRLDRDTFRHTVIGGAAERKKRCEAFLESVTLLSNLTSSDRSAVADVMASITFADGQQIIRQGDMGDSFYIVESGTACVTKDTVEVKKCNVGDYFGELALLKAEPRAATVTAVGPVRCFALDKAAFDRLLGSALEVLNKNTRQYGAGGAGDDDDEEEESEEESEEEDEGDFVAPTPPPTRGRGRRLSVSSECYNPANMSTFQPKKITKPAETLERIGNAVKENFLFSKLSPSDLNVVRDAMFEAKYRQHDVIIQQGEEGDNFYVIESGEVNVFVSKAGEKRQKVATFGPGKSFGELALMYTAPRAATVIAASANVVTWAVDRETFRHILMDSGNKSAKVHEAFLEKISLLASLTDRQRSTVADELISETFVAGSSVITQGEQGDRFYILENGEAQAVKNGVGIVKSYATGDYFGELAILTGKPRAASIRAVTDVTVLYMDRKAFKRLLGPVEDLMRQHAASTYGTAGGEGSEAGPSADTLAIAGNAPVVMAGRKRKGAVSAETKMPSAVDPNRTKPVFEKSSEDSAFIQGIISKNILFSGLDSSDMNDVVMAMQQKAFGVGDAIIKQGDIGDFYYIVSDGEADVFVNDDHKLTVGKGQGFGELALMYDCPRAATVKAKGAVTTWALDRDTFHSLLVDNQSAKRSQYEAFIGGLELFKTLEKQEISTLADALMSTSFNDGEEIIRQGDNGDTFFIIESGNAKAVKDGAVDAPVMLYKTGDYFGELALINNAARAASVIADGPVKCAVLDRARFSRVLGDCRELLQRNAALYGKYEGDVEADSDSDEYSDDSDNDSDEEMDTIEENCQEQRRHSSLKSRRIGVSAEVSSLEMSSEIFLKNIQKDADTRGRIKAVFEENVLFGACTEEDRDQLCNCMRLEEMAAGREIIKQGDTDAQCFYIVDTGVVNVFIQGPSDEAPRLTSSIGKGGAFGELALLYNAPRAATVVCKDQGTCWVIDREQFQFILVDKARLRREAYEGFLQQVPLLSSLTQDERSRIADSLEPVSYNHGEKIISEGDPGNTFFIIEEGKAVARKAGSDEVMQQYTPLVMPSYFGELSLLHNKPRAADVIAVGQVKCVTLSRSSFDRILGPCESILRRNVTNYKNFEAEIEEMEEEEEEEEEEDSQEPEAPAPVIKPRSRKAAVSAESTGAATVDPNFKPKVIAKSEAETAAIKAALKTNTVLFSDLSPLQETTVVGALEKVSYDAGKEIMKQGDMGDFFYICINGTCDVFVNGNNVATKGAGEMFGELALLYNAPRNATISAKTSVELWSLDRQTFRHVLVQSGSESAKASDDALAKVPVLSSLSKQERAQLSDSMATETFKAGAVVMSQGDDGSTMYIISAGSASVTRVPGQGMPAEEVARCGAGDYFGELALLTSEPRAATVTASSDLTCLTIDRKTFSRLLGPCKAILMRNMSNYRTYSAAHVAIKFQL